jgi:hypothetical protein
VISRLPAARSPSWVLAETATAAAFSFFSLMLIARVIGPDAAGLGAVAIAAFLLFDLACASLFTDALVQRASLSERHVRSALTVQVLVGVAGALALALLAPAVAHVAEAPEVSELILALAALLPFSAFSGASAGLVLRAHRYRLLALRALLGQPLALLAGLLVAAGGHGAWALIAQQATGTAVTFALMLAFGRHRLKPAVAGRALADWWPVAGPQILAVIVLAGRYRLFVLALGALTTEAVVAVCNVAFRLLDSALAIVWGSVARLSVPRLSTQQGNRAAMAEIYGHLAQLQALMACRSHPGGARPGVTRRGGSGATRRLDRGALLLLGRSGEPVPRPRQDQAQPAPVGGDAGGAGRRPPCWAADHGSGGGGVLGERHHRAGAVADLVGAARAQAVAALAPWSDRAGADRHRRHGRAGDAVAKDACPRPLAGRRPRRKRRRRGMRVLRRGVAGARPENIRVTVRHGGAAEQGR